MTDVPRPPRTYEQFIAAHPGLEKAWGQISEAGRSGPLDDKTVRLIKLGIAMGAQREGPVHAGVRKALALGITPEEVQQIVALTAGTLGLPASVAAFSWVRDVLGNDD